MAALEAGTPIIATTIDRALIRELSLLTAKPFIYVFNCDADELADEDAQGQDAGRSWRRPRRSSSTRSSSPSWSSSTTTTRPARCSPRWASTSPASTMLARVGFDTLGLQTYLTAGPKETRAWTIRKGATAPEAAGVIHTDFQRGFIKAEIVSFDDLDGRRLDAEGQGGRQGPHGGQGLRHGRRRRGGVPLQRVANATAGQRRFSVAQRSLCPLSARKIAEHLLRRGSRRPAGSGPRRRARAWRRCPAWCSPWRAPAPAGR